MSQRKLDMFFPSNKRTRDVKTDVNQENSEVNIIENSVNSGKKWKRSLNISTFHNWKKSYGWLGVSNSGGLQCSICLEFPNIADNKTAFVKQDGCQTFKLESIKFHDRSDGHQKCSARKSTRENPDATPLALCQRKMSAEALKQMEILFNTAYTIAFRGLPFTDFIYLCELQKKNGVQVSDQYLNRTACTEFIHYIARSANDEILTELKECSFFSLSCDSATDVSSSENVAFVVHYLPKNSSDVKHKLLKLSKLPNATADGYLQAFTTMVEGINLLQWKEKTMAFSTDGANVMIGRQDGFVAKLPADVLPFHCVGHRLQLCVMDANTAVPDFQDFMSIVTTLCDFYINSPKQYRELLTTADIFEEGVQRFSNQHSAKWVSAKHQTFCALLQNLPLIDVHLQNSYEKNKVAKVKGLHAAVTSDKFKFYLHAATDIYAIIKEASLAVQKQNFYIPQLSAEIKRLIFRLQSLKSVPGKYVSELKKSNPEIVKKSYMHSYDNYISSLLKSLSDRIDAAVKKENFTSCCEVLNPQNWPDRKSGEFFSYGTEEVLHMLSVLHENNGSVCDNEKVRSEWETVKLISSTKAYMSFKELVEVIVEKESDFYELHVLIAAVMSIAVTTAKCESVFSVQKQVKTPARNCLEEDTLSDLVKIKADIECSITDFNPHQAISLWYRDSRRGRYIH